MLYNSMHLGASLHMYSALDRTDFGKPHLQAPLSDDQEKKLQTRPEMSLGLQTAAKGRRRRGACEPDKPGVQNEKAAYGMCSKTSR